MMAKTHPPQKRRKQGFTLMEVMVCMGLFSILVPAILLTNIHLQQKTLFGTRHVTSMSNSRIVQMKLIRLLNSARGPVLDSNGSTLQMRHYDEASDSWKYTSLTHNTTTAQMIYTDPDGTEEVLSDGIYADRDLPVFSAEDELIRCHFYIGELSENQFTNEISGVIVSLAINPRNTIIEGI